MTKGTARPARLGRRIRRRGYSAIVLLLSFTVLLAFLAMAIDWSAVASAKAELQVAADAAAVGGASALPDTDEALVRAEAYAAEISIRGEAVKLVDEDVIFGTWDSDARTFTEGVEDVNAIKVTVRRELEMPIMKMLGMPTLTLEAVAGGGATSGGPAPDLVIVQDVTSSFSAEIADARNADAALVDCVYEKADDQTKIGLTAFTGFELNLLAPTTLTTYAAGYTTVKSKISKIKICGSTGMPSCSGTNIAAGLYLAKNILDGSDSAPEIGRAAILVSDGAPNADSAVCTKTGSGKTKKYQSDASAYFCPGWSNSPTDAKLKTAALTMQTKFEDAGYDLYTVFYNETSDATQSAFMEQLTAGDGIYLESPDSSDIGDFLQDICRSYVTQKPGLIF